VGSAKRNKNVRPTINKQAKIQRPHVELVHIQGSRRRFSDDLANTIDGSSMQ
jgi:hypothetical protein